jgi:hypothetical protein
MDMAMDMEKAIDMGVTAKSIIVFELQALWMASSETGEEAALSLPCILSAFYPTSPHYCTWAFEFG